MDYNQICKKYLTYKTEFVVNCLWVILVFLLNKYKLEFFLIAFSENLKTF